MSNGMENHSSDKTPKSTSDKKKLTINHRYEVREYRQESGSSKMYNGFDLATKNDVLIKFIRVDKVRSQFQTNYSLLDQGIVPKLIWEEVIDEIQVFVYELLGPDLQTLSNRSVGKFSYITIAMIFHLAILALEKLHLKEIVHTNLKPSKFLFDQQKGDARFILTGFELSEKMNKGKLNRSRSGTPRKKRSYENIFSSLNVHAGESIGYRDDLESLSYMIINFFTQGKFFKKVTGSNAFSKKSRELLVSLKTNVLSEILLSGIPLEIFDFIKYISKLKVSDMPNYEYLKGLSIKLCQRFYMKKDIIACLDWIQIPPEEHNIYRSKMLSYFFCMSIPQVKKKTTKIDELSLTMKRKSSSKTTMNSSGYLMKSFQGMPIHEIAESAENSKILPEFFTPINDEEYLAAPPTARLALGSKVYLSQNGSNVRMATQPGVDFYNVESISSGGSSPRSLPKMDSLDDIDVTEEEGIDHQSKYLDSTQINLKVPDPIAILKPTLNRSATAVDLRNKSPGIRRPPATLRPAPMQFKMMPK